YANAKKQSAACSLTYSCKRDPSGDTLDQILITPTRAGNVGSVSRYIQIKDESKLFTRGQLKQSLLEKYGQPSDNSSQDYRLTWGWDENGKQISGYCRSNTRQEDGVVEIEGKDVELVTETLRQLNTSCSAMIEASWRSFDGGDTQKNN